ncbi:Protein ABSCISIC ACID-INSENSITIVE 5 [Forsythia ovata]|uniref:Protein ABSCISIC ACID-INSENSITIVE 5 n=1 Tax=Forsythia ovata TaxID=205694 RepID=A0ABD1WX31_9LAMI
MRNSSAGGFGQVQGLGMGSPVSPVSSERLCTNQVENSNHYGLDMNGMKGGRKRILDGPVEKAYTVELEAELNHLKEENAHLKQTLAKLERKRKQQYFEEARMKSQSETKAQKTNEKLRVMRRSLSCPY